MTPDAPLAFLDDLDETRVRLRLEAVRRLLQALGDPQDALHVIHVGGTNGKGSVVAFLEGILREAGGSVGAYTSPHLLRVEERVRVDGDPLEGAALARAASRVQAAIDDVDDPEDPITSFEAGTALALEALRDAQVDVALLEVGMGGRLDATNIVEDPWCTVLTTVSLEHTEHLGDTLEEVAQEKTGILKPGVPLVTGARGEALDHVLRVAELQGAPTWALGRDLHVRDLETSLEGTSFRLEGMDRDHGRLETTLPGAHQAANAALACKVVEVLAHEGHLVVPVEAVRAGVAATRWPGRLQLVPGTPGLLLDGAHNPAAAEALAAFLQAQDLPDVTLLVGVLEGKDLGGIAGALAPVAGEAVATRPSSPRARHPRDVARAFSAAGVVGTVVEDLGHALDTARGQAGEDGLVVVTGSLALVADVLRHLEEAHRSPWDRLKGWLRGERD